MQIIGNGAKGHHKFTLEVTEIVKDDSIQNNTTYLNYTFKISPLSYSWDWNSWGNRISYTITIGDNTYTGTIPAYDGYSTVTLKSGNNIPIVHDNDGTKTINISFKVVDGANQSYTCGNASASDTMTLTALHKAPLITQAQITAENNTALTNLTGFQTTTVVQYLSKKTFTISATTYDSATITKYEIYHNGIKIGESNTNAVSIDFADVGELQVVNNNQIMLPLVAVAIDSLNGRGEQEFYYNIIQYTKPTIQKTISTIKRKSGSGTVLTDNICVLNFTGNIYKGDDVVGNANSQQVQYKIWNDIEPNYSNVASTLSSGDVTITDYQINNILYTKSYDYKIKIKDLFIDSDATDYVKIDRVPTGKPLWSEYKDRVDFSKITQNGNEIVEKGIVLYEGYLQGNDSIPLNLIDYKTLKIYANSYSTQIIFDLDLTTENAQTQTSSQPYTSSGVGSYYADSQSQFELHICEAGVNLNKTTFYNIYMGYVRGGTTNTRNNNSDYYIYKIEGYE